MDGMINNNFLFGYIVSKGLDKQDAMMNALTTSQLRGPSPIGIVGIKKMVDRVLDLQGERDRFKGGLEKLEAFIKDPKYQKCTVPELLEALKKEKIIS